MHKILHMEESPHKCPVCSRSFNQRSNLKTHLLTHTDHKPYECNSCGKVFRRNCDLRRHALTHAVGDVPADGLGDGFVPTPNEIEPLSPRPRSPSLDPQEALIPERTQCHEPCSSSSPYTMRPHPEHGPDRRHEHDLDDPDLDEEPEIDPGQEENPDREPHHPQLQIRRDLHHPHVKTATITSGAMELGFLGPFRKRQLDTDRPSTSSGGRHTPPLSLRMAPMHLPPPPSHMMPQSVPIPPSPPVLKPPDTGLLQLSVPLQQPSSAHISSLPRSNLRAIALAPSQSPSSNNYVSDLSMKKDELPPPRPPQNPPKKTGFTIEDIMRR